MLEKITEIIKSKDYICPRGLILNYKQFNLNCDELALLIYLLNSDLHFNPKQISNDLNMTLNDA